jgi:hypothetical protein
MKNLMFFINQSSLIGKQVSIPLNNYSLGFVYPSSKFRSEVLMRYTATTHMEKKTKIFKGEAIGCLNSEYELIYFKILHNSMS